MTNDAYNRKLTTYTDNIPDASQVIFRNLLCSFFSGFPCVRGKQVALITYGFNAVGLGGAVLQFFSQARNRHINATIHSVVTYAAQIFQQCIPVHNLPGMSCQLLQQVKICG